MIAFKFLAAGALAPFTSFPWPAAGTWVSAPRGRAERWIHACRAGDLPYWLDEELWRIELEDPVRESRYQIASPRARLASRVGAWGPALAGEYARACALRARELALPHVARATRDALAGATDLDAIAVAASGAGSASSVASLVADAARSALHAGPAPSSYLAARLAATLGGGLEAFEAERAWQARWLAERLGEAEGGRSGA